MKPRTPWIWLVAVELCACATMARRDHQASPERYMPYAGPPIERFYFHNSNIGWQTLSDDKLVIFVANDAYLLTVAPPCAELRFALQIRLSESSFGSVSRYDYVLFERQKCLIEEIKQIDYTKLKQDEAKKPG
jgi:hypothetical protein